MISTGLFIKTKICLVFMGILIVPAHLWADSSPLQMPASVSSGPTKSLSVQLEVQSDNYTLTGPSPTAQQNDPAQNPIVKARGIKLTHSKPASAEPPANDLLMGPTLRVRPGDKLDILFKNNLVYKKSAGDGSDSTTIPHGFDVLNLHTHGLHVSPNNPSDNVLMNIFPKGTPEEPLHHCHTEFGKNNCIEGKYAYSYSIPTNHPSGTYWYHAHKHGAVAMHLANGIAGALIIEDPKHGLESLPAVKSAREQIIMLQQITYGGHYPDTDTHYGRGTQSDPYHIDCMSVYGNQQGCTFSDETPATPGITNSTALSVNGQFQPTITLWTNEVQLWRVINGTTGNVVPMCLLPVDSNNAQQLSTYVLAADGIPVQNPAAGEHDLPVLLKIPVATPKNGADLVNNELQLLAAGQRLDLMVQAPAQPGTYALYGTGNCQAPASGTPLPTPVLTVTVQAPVGEVTYNTELPTQRALNELTTPKTITAAESPSLPTQGAVFGFTNGEFAPADGFASVINARVFNPLRSQRNLSLKQVDLWSAQSAAGTHMFHIHINSFQLVSRGQLTYPFPIWRDTLLINKPENSASGEIVQFLQRPLDFTGALVMHCHNVFHEDTGMMELVKIEPPLGSSNGKGGSNTKPSH